MDSVAHFCNFRDALELTHVSARWRQVPEIVRMLGVVREIARGGAALDDMNKYSRLIRAQFPYGEARELSSEDLARRVRVLVALRLGLMADDMMLPETLFGFMIRGEHIRSAIDICLAIKSIVIGKRSREYFDCIAGNIAVLDWYRRVMSWMITMAVDSIGVDPRVVDFIDCVLDQNFAKARECIPELADLAIERMYVPESTYLAISVANKMGPVFARRITAHTHYKSVIAHYARDSPEFVGALDKFAQLPEYSYVTGSEMLSSAAKNEDPRAFNRVYDSLVSFDMIGAECSIDWDHCEGFETLARAVHRIESRGIRATFWKIMVIRKPIEVTLPLYEDAIRAVDFMLARCAREIESYYKERRAAYFAQDGSSTKMTTHDCWPVIKYLGWCSGLFGERMSRVIASHFKSSPRLLEKIESRKVAQTWSYFDETFKIK